MTVPAWAWDDAHIADDAILYRRVPRVPDCLVQDLSTGDMVVNPAAALRHDKEDGMSIYRDELLKKEYGYGVAEVCTDWTTHGVLQFRAGDVRNVPDSAAGVHDEVDTDDPRIGRAHALIRCPNRATGHHKPVWNPIRAAIARAATWIDKPT